MSLLRSFLSTVIGPETTGNPATSLPAGPPPPCPTEALSSHGSDRLTHEMYERDHRDWYVQHGPTLTGYVNSAKKGVRSLLTWGGTDLTGGLCGRVASWTLGPARPNVTRLIDDLRTATLVSAGGLSHATGAHVSAAKGYDDRDLQSRVAALSAFPDSMAEFWDKSELHDVCALQEVAKGCSRDLEVKSALRFAAAGAYSDIASRTQSNPFPFFSSIGNSTYNMVSEPLRSYLNSGPGLAQSREHSVAKLSAVLPGYAPLTDDEKKKIETNAWRSDLISYVPRTLAYCASSFLPSPLGALGTVATLVV